MIFVDVKFGLHAIYKLRQSFPNFFDHGTLCLIILACGTLSQKICQHRLVKKKWILILHVVIKELQLLSYGTTVKKYNFIKLCKQI